MGLRLGKDEAMDQDKEQPKQQITNDPYEALIIACNSLMTDTGYVYSNKDDGVDCKNSGVYNLSYYHITCPLATVQLTAISLGSNLNIFGHVDNEKTSCSLCLNMEQLKDADSFDVDTVLNLLPDLSRKFKDEIALSLLASVQYSSNVPISFGMHTLPREIKLAIFKYLPVTDLISTSKVSNEMKELVDSPYIWKHALFRDFPRVMVPKNSQPVNWKELYKKEYKDAQKRRHDVNVMNQILPNIRAPRPYFDHWNDQFWDATSDRFLYSPDLDFVDTLNHAFAPPLALPRVSLSSEFDSPRAFRIKSPLEQPSPLFMHGAMPSTEPTWAHPPRNNVDLPLPQMSNGSLLARCLPRPLRFQTPNIPPYGYNHPDYLL